MNKLNVVGTIIPIVTPFGDDDLLDETALRRLIQRLIRANVQGIMPVGSSGEFWAVEDYERDRILEVTLEEVANRIPVYAGTCAISTRKSIDLAKRAERLGADALVVLSPYYFAPRQEELYAYYCDVAASVSLPILPYNNPKRTGGIALTPETVVRLAREGSIVGIKDSSGNLALVAEMIENTPDDFAVYQGCDDLIFSSLVIGAVGGIAATGNVVPELVVELYNSFLASDWNRARAIQKKLATLRNAFGWSAYPAILKAAMETIGEPMGRPRRPVLPVCDTQLETLRALLSYIRKEDSLNYAKE